MWVCLIVILSLSYIVSVVWKIVIIVNRSVSGYIKPILEFSHVWMKSIKKTFWNASLREAILQKIPFFYEILS